MKKQKILVLEIQESIYKDFNIDDVEYILPGVIHLYFGNNATIYKYLVQQHLDNFINPDNFTIVYPSTEAGAVAAAISHFDLISRVFGEWIQRWTSVSLLNEFCDSYMVVEVQLTDDTLWLQGELW